jgi:hypothetical protein
VPAGPGEHKLIYTNWLPRYDPVLLLFVVSVSGDNQCRHLSAATASTS